MPQWNDPIRCIKANPQWVERDDCLNELREDRGAYRLRVRKQQFEEGCAVLMCILGVVCGVVSLAVLLSVKFDGSNGTNGVASG